MAIASTHPLPSGTRFGPESPFFEDRSNLSDRERLGSWIAGVLLLGYGLVRRSVPCAALGGYLAYRGHSGRCRLFESLGLDSRGGASIPRPSSRTASVSRKPRKATRSFYVRRTST